MSFTAEGKQPRRGLTLVAMTGSLSMIFIDITVIGVALPRIQSDLAMSDATLQWVVNAYVLAMASLVALGGRAADLIGRVPAFVIGVIIFALSSLACGMAASATILIAGRVLQGVGAALMQPASGAIVISSFAPGERGKAMAVYVGIPLLFMVIGPVVGGLLTQVASWRWCFWVNLPVAAIALFLTALARPADQRSTARRIDVVGAVMLLIGLPSLVLGIQQSSSWGWRSLLTPLLVFGGGLVVIAFVRRQWKRAEPLLAVGLFRDRGLLANALILFLMQFAMTGLVIHGSVYAQAVLGFDPMMAGLSMLPLMVPTLIVVHIAGRLYDRVGVRTPALVGTISTLLGAVVLALGAAWQSYLIIAIGMGVMGLGIGFVMSPTNTDSMSRVPAAMRAQVSGLIQTMRQVGGTLGLAVIGAVVLFAQARFERDRMPTPVPGSEESERSALIAHALEGRLSAIAELGRASPAESREVRGIAADSIAIGYWCGAVACALSACAAALLHRSSAPAQGRTP